MNSNQPPQGQMPQGQQNGNPQFAARPPVHLFRPEQMRSLPPNFSAEEKQKWENGLQTLYNILETADPTSDKAQEARKKIYDFSMTLNKKILALTRPQPQAQQATQQQQPQNIAQPSAQSQQPPQMQNNGAIGGPQGQPQRQLPGGMGPASKLTENMRQHLDAYKLVLPDNLQANTPDAEAWIKQQKDRYGAAMGAMETCMHNLKQLENMKATREQGGNPLSADELKEWTAKKMAIQKRYGDAKSFSSSFRTRHQAANVTGQQANAAPQQQQPTQQPPQQGTATAQTAPPRPSLNPQQPNTNAAAQQNTQTVSAAFEAARNQQQMSGQRPGSVSGPQQDVHGQMPNGQQGGQNTGPNIKMEGGIGVPQINTAVTAQAPHMQQRPVQNSPQTAGPPQSATSQGPPRPLSQQAALQQSARTYSQGAGATPQVMAHAPQNMGRDPTGPNNIKMPIPKTLPPAATAIPQPVPMGPSRPTLSGGSNNAGNAMMGQPVMHKVPVFDIQGEGERVMNKKKLDELVRQVTGGGEGLDSGEGLTAEVEDCVLSVADEFVDQVITAACRCAKARGSKTLEIRDIQLILERNYNIRIPGYASDEIRTVRKFQPAQGWIAKMSAIQAAKVTGGKGDL